MGYAQLKTIKFTQVRTIFQCLVINYFIVFFLLLGFEYSSC